MQALQHAVDGGHLDAAFNFGLMYMIIMIGNIVAQSQFWQNFFQNCDCATNFERSGTHYVPNLVCLDSSKDGAGPFCGEVVRLATPNCVRYSSELYQRALDGGHWPAVAP